MLTTWRICNTKVKYFYAKNVKRVQLKGEADESAETYKKWALKATSYYAESLN